MISATGRRPVIAAPIAAPRRSEEHTSELQSLKHLLCRLLLEKKNNVVDFLRLVFPVTQLDRQRIIRTQVLAMPDNPYVPRDLCTRSSHDRLSTGNAHLRRQPS